LFSLLKQKQIHYLHYYHLKLLFHGDGDRKKAYSLNITPMASTTLPVIESAFQATSLLSRSDSALKREVEALKDPNAPKKKSSASKKKELGSVGKKAESSPKPPPPHPQSHPNPNDDPFAYRHYVTMYPSSNKILEKRWDERTRELHLKRLKEARPSIDNSPPKVYSHLANRAKRMKQEERMIYFFWKG
jgi:hypothetical protein